MKKSSLVLATVVPLASCMNGAVMTGGAPETATTQELCRIMHWDGNGFDYGAEAAFLELSRRGEFSGRELDGIKNGFPRIGDSENAALCGQGFFYDDVNTTTTAAGTRKQYVISNGFYIYVEGGVVTAIQT